MNNVVALSVALALTTVAVSSASAQPSSQPLGPSAPLELRPPAIDPEPSWTSRDWVMAPLYGTLVGAGAGLGLGYLGYQVDGDCLDVGRDCTPIVMAMGVYSGMIIGAATAVSTYGSRRGFKGSFRSALLGAVIGNVGSGLPAALAFKILGDDLGPPVALAAIFGVPALGATIFYRISDHRARRDEPMHGALIDVNEGRASLSVPALSVGRDRGALSVYAPIVAGSF